MIGVPSQRVRVAHLTLGLDVGGQERLLVEMARHRNTARFDWIVVVLSGRGTLAGAIEAQGVRVIALNTPHGWQTSLWPRLVRIFRQERIDVVHTHDDRPLIYGMPSAWWVGVRQRIHTHHHGRLPPVSRRQSWLIRHTSRFVQRFVCVSHDSARFMIEQGIAPSRISTLWNGIDLTRFAYQGPCPGGSIVTVARLSPEKDIANLLQAARFVVAAFPDIRFEIAGDGPCRQELAQQVNDFQLTKHVVFHGEMRDIPSLLARARLFVLPSQSEGISLTLLEAMARGLPLVTTNVGGNPEVVEPNITGILVPPSDPIALARAIQTILPDPELAIRLGRAGRQRVENYFDVRKMMEKYEVMYEDHEELITSS